MLHKNTKVKVHSLNGDIDFFDIIAGVLQGDTLLTNTPAQAKSLLHSLEKAASGA